VAADILDFSGAPAGFTPDLGASSTRSPDAYRHYLAGMGYLYQWDMVAAFERVRTAVELDSTFAQAYHRLSMSMVWGDDRMGYASYGMTSPAEFRRVALDAAESAVRHSDDLSWRERQHMLAHAAFYQEMWGGTQNYSLARSLYKELVAADSTDAEAWFGLADVEYHDFYGAVQDSSGVWKPARNWNVSVTGFRRAVELDPSFVLGYGHLIDLYQQVNRSDRFESVPVPRGEPDDVRAQQRVYFYRAWQDSARVVVFDGPAEALDVLGRNYDPEAVDELLDRAAGAARSWSAAAPADHRPHSEMYQAYASARRHARALEALRAALAFMGDTTMLYRSRLASAYLGSGIVDTGLAYAEDVLGALEEGAEEVGSAAIVSSVFLAAGQPARAMRVMELGLPDSGGPADYSSRRPPFHPSRRGLGQIPYHGTGRVIELLIAFGTVGADRPELHEALDSLEALWFQSDYSEAEARELAQWFARAVTPALFVIGNPALERWQGWIDTIPVSWDIHSLWQADSTAAAVALLGNAVLELDTARAWPGVMPREFYVLAGLAQALDQDSLAIVLYAHGDGSFVGLRGPSPYGFRGDWGQRSLSHLLRAESYEALGKIPEAIDNYDRFLELWDDAEPDLQVFSERARAGVTRLRADR
jgi:tetratricopeptide (TPR) repeat protein